MPNPISPNAKWYDPTALTSEKTNDPDAAACTNCGCTFLVQEEAYQFPKQHNVILGQRVQPLYDMPFYVFRCLKCNEVFEPQVQAGARDAARKLYDKFLDTMEAPSFSKGEKL